MNCSFNRISLSRQERYNLECSLDTFIEFIFSIVCCSALHMNSQETEKPCKSVSWKVDDDSSVLEDAVKYASKQQITGSHEVLSYNDSVV